MSGILKNSSHTIKEFMISEECSQIKNIHDFIVYWKHIWELKKDVDKDFQTDP